MGLKEYPGVNGLEIFMGPLVNVNPSTQDRVAAVNGADFAQVFMRFGIGLKTLLVSIDKGQGRLGLVESAQLTINPMVLALGLQRRRILVHHQKEAASPFPAADQIAFKVQFLGGVVVIFAAQCPVGEQKIKHGKMRSISGVV